MDKKLPTFKDATGNYLTQSLFIDFNYQAKYAIYCLADEDKEYEGVLYPSLKKLYLDMQDATEYLFASTYLGGWAHWQRICNNAILAKHVEVWREELELKLKSVAMQAMLQKANGGDFNAAKWLASKGWLGERGRPSKQELANEKKKRDRQAKETATEAAAIAHLLPSKKG